MGLGTNEIDKAGVQYLADALKSNHVRESSLDLSDDLRYSQTLTTLNLSSNDIGDEGVQSLAKALKTNRVRNEFSAFVISFVIL